MPVEMKNLQVEPNGKGMYFIKYSGGGQLPKYLEGLYTSEQLALNKAKIYLANRKNYPSRKRAKTSGD